MTRIVGTKDRNEFVLDRATAWRRARALDRMLASATPPQKRGVQRAPHAEFNRLDDLRSLEIAKRINTA
jgi:hypothetical protein